MPKYKTRSGRLIDTSKELGRGGEGFVSEVKGSSSEVAKIYHPNNRTNDKERKLEEMVSNPPSDASRNFSPPHITIAWPVDFLYDSAGFAGFMMPRINKNPEIHDIWSTNNRNQNYSHFDWRHLHRVAKNLAVAIHALHLRGYIVGDVNLRNILVTTDAMVTLVDTDSFQVREKSGKTHRCPVGLPEYTPPELQGFDMRTLDRHERHDCFGLGVLIFQLLMEGFHPFTGAQKNLVVSYGRVDLHCIKHGIFTYQSNTDFDPPPGAPDFSGLDATLRNLFVRCFVDGHNDPSKRPSAKEWLDALGNAEQRLLNCATDRKHWYSPHGSGCHLCELERKRSNRTVQPPPPVQRPLTLPPTPPYVPPPYQPPPIQSNSSSIGGLIVVICICLLIIFGLINIFSSLGGGASQAINQPSKSSQTATEVSTPKPVSPPPTALSQAPIIPKPDVSEKKPETAGMVSIPGGCFDMGDTFRDGGSEETPVHRVCLDDFKMDMNLVTNAEFENWKPGFQESRNAEHDGKKVSPSDNTPVVMVTWDEAKGYCESVGKRLPTEAEWEYVARRGGSKVEYAKPTNTTMPVGVIVPSARYLYDMAGNIWEWTADWYGPYSSGEQRNPQGPSSGMNRVLRNGSWYYNANSMRASYRYGKVPNYRSDSYGFRCAMEEKQPQDAGAMSELEKRNKETAATEQLAEAQRRADEDRRLAAAKKLEEDQRVAKKSQVKLTISNQNCVPLDFYMNNQRIVTVQANTSQDQMVDLGTSAVRACAPNTSNCYQESPITIIGPATLALKRDDACNSVSVWGRQPTWPTMQQNPR